MSKARSLSSRNPLFNIRKSIESGRLVEGAHFFDDDDDTIDENKKSVWRSKSVGSIISGYVVWRK
jgi:hypothetical protein